MTAAAAYPVIASPRPAWRGLIWIAPLTALWIVLIYWQPIIPGSGVQTTAHQLMTHALIALGLWLGLEGTELEHMLEEVLNIPDRNQQTENAEARRRRIAASIACHAAIKINQPLEPSKIDWLLTELAKTEHPTACPHGRPIALRYSHKDIQRAFQRI